MADNETRIKITAVDAATATLNQIKGAAGDLTNSFTRLQGAFAAIGATAALGGLVSSVSSAIKAAAAMEELSQKTGIATEQLSALDYAMRREGVATEAFGKAVKELSKNMVEAGDATSKAGKLFAALGVNTQGSTREALLQISDAFQKLPDGATKAALATQLFGKAGLDLIPALNNGAAGIREMEEEARKLGLTFGGESGKQAKQFADQVFAIQESGRALGVTLATQALPSLIAITSTMKIAAENGGLLNAVLQGLRESFATVFLGDAVKNRVGDIQKQIADLEKLDKEGPGLLERITGLDQSENIRAKILALKQELAGLLAFQSATPSSGGAQKSTESPEAKKLKDIIDRLLAGLGSTKPAVDAFEKSLDSLQNKLDSVSSGFSADFAPSVEILNKALEKGAISLERHEDLMAKLVKQQPIYKAGIEAQAKLEESVAKALADGAQERRRQLESIQESIDRRREENETFGLTEEQIASLTIARLEERLAILQASGAMEDELANLAEEIELRKQLRDQIGRGEGIRQAQERASKDLQDQLSLWDEISDRGSRFFYDLALNGKDAFSSLKQSLKSFAAEMVALFAKKWILQLGASLTGSTALSALAGQTGDGSLAGSLLGSLGGAAGGLLQSGLSSILGGGTGGAVAASELLGMAAAAGPYIAAIAAAYTLFETFRDQGENWKGRLGFGSMANAYSVDGVFGREGFQYLAGNDAVNRSIQSFLASTRPLDEQLSRRLTAGQITSVQGRLSAYNTSGTRADGQPAEFAFGKDDDTAAGQLTLEYLKVKYGAVFDEIDSEFAAFIRGYTGKSEDLLKAIGEFAGVLDGLDAIGIPGLDLESLKGFQKQGEELGQTFARIAQQFSEYQNLFLTDSEKLGLVQKSVAQGFADLGIEVPKTNEEFKKLVAGLDLSTEEGRRLFEGLMNLAPAFATVTAAADQLFASFTQIASRRNPALGRFLGEQELEKVVKEFMARNPWTQGMDWRAVAREINLITSYEGGAADFRGYSAEDQALILRILGISDDLEGLGDAADDAADSLGGLGPGVAAAINSMRDVKMSIWEFLRGLFTDGEFSPLDPSQRLDTLKSRFTTTIAQANSGNITAAQSIPELITEILKLGRENFASGPGYIDLFNWVTGLAGDFVQPGGGMELQRLAYEEQRRQSNIMADVRAILISIRDGGTADGALVSSAVVNAGLATERK